MWLPERKLKKANFDRDDKEENEKKYYYNGPVYKRDVKGDAIFLDKRKQKK